MQALENIINNLRNNNQAQQNEDSDSQSEDETPKDCSNVITNEEKADKKKKKKADKKKEVKTEPDSLDKIHEIIAVAKEVFEIGKSVYNYFTAKSGEVGNRELEKAYKMKNEELRRKEERVSTEIEELKRKLNEQNDKQNQIEFQKQKEELEKERIENENKMKVLEAITKCKEDLSNHYMSCLMQTFQNFEKEQEKLFENLIFIIDQNLQEFKEKTLPNLFNELWENQNLSEKLDEVTLTIIKENFKNKELKKMTFMLIGSSGVEKVH